MHSIYVLKDGYLVHIENKTTGKNKKNPNKTSNNPQNNYP